MTVFPAPQAQADRQAASSHEGTNTTAWISQLGTATLGLTGGQVGLGSKGKDLPDRIVAPKIQPKSR